MKAETDGVIDGDEDIDFQYEGIWRRQKKRRNMKIEDREEENDEVPQYWWIYLSCARNSNWADSFLIVVIKMLYVSLSIGIVGNKVITNFLNIVIEATMLHTIVLQYIAN